ncbi:MAG: hypothetical protein Q8K78_15285 [Planctomycetaceae bacterium]|nr:hypothetical protein [Planctomycetaceae bacterium]
MTAADLLLKPSTPPDVWRRRGWYGLIGLFTLTVMYWLSIFPVCWFYMRYHLPEPYSRIVAVSYQPVVEVIVRLPRPLRDAVDWGIGFGAPDGITVDAGDPTGIRWSKPGYNVTFLGW